MDPDVQPAQRLFDDLLARHSSTGLVGGRMFGCLAFLLNGKVVGLIKGDEIAFKLGVDSAEQRRALALDDAVRFDPSGQGRPYRGWVAIPYRNDEDFDGMLAAAITTSRAAQSVG